MTQRAETWVPRLGATHLVVLQPFDTIFGKIQAHLGTVGFQIGLRQELTQSADSVAETQDFWPFNKHL